MIRSLLVCAALLLLSGVSADAGWPIRGSGGLPGSPSIPQPLIVSTAGNDSYPGTVGSPILTAAHAKTLIATALTNGVTDPVVEFRGNTVSAAHVTFTGVIADDILTVSSPTGAIQGGDWVNCSGCAANTYVTEFVSGTGGAGTYRVSPPGQTVGSVAMSGTQPALYPVPSTLSFGSANSAISGHVVTYRNYPGEFAALSGGTAITGTFTLCTTADAICNGGSNGVYQAPLSIDTRELYVGGNSVVRAYNGAASFYPAGWSVDGSGNFTAPVNATTPTSSWANINDIQIVTGAGWQHNFCNINTIVGTAITQQNPCNAAWVDVFLPNVHVGHATPLWIENAYELMPTCGAGCWYRSRAASGTALANTLYYHPRAGEDIATVPVVVPITTHLLTFAGASNITFSNLGFLYATWLLPSASGGYVSQQNGYFCNAGACYTVAGLPTVPSSGAIDLTTTQNSNITFSHDMFGHLSGHAIFIEHGNQNITVDAGLCFNNAGGCVQFGDITDYEQTTPGLQTANITVSNTWVGVTFEYLDSGGIFMPFARNSTITHNYSPQNWWGPFTTGWGDIYYPVNYNAANTVSFNVAKNACIWPMVDCGSYYANSLNTPTYNGNVSWGKGNDLGQGQFFQACFYADGASSLGTWTNNLCDGPITALGSGYYSGGSYAFIQNTTVTQTFTGTYSTTALVNNTNSGGGSTFSVGSGSPYTEGDCPGVSCPAGATAILNAAGLTETPGP